MSCGDVSVMRGVRAKVLFSHLRGLGTGGHSEGLVILVLSDSSGGSQCYGRGGNVGGFGVRGEGRGSRWGSRSFVVAGSVGTFRHLLNVGIGGFLCW